jgi:hypothetical protein
MAILAQDAFLRRKNNLKCNRRERDSRRFSPLDSYSLETALNLCPFTAEALDLLLSYQHIHLIYGSTAIRRPLFQSLNIYTVGRTPWMGDEPVARPLPTHGTTQTQNKRTQTSMRLVGFKPTIPVFEWATVIGTNTTGIVVK